MDFIIILYVVAIIAVAISVVVWMHRVSANIHSIRTFTSMLVSIEKKRAEKEGIEIDLQKLYDEASK